MRSLDRGQEVGFRERGWNFVIPMNDSLILPYSFEKVSVMIVDDQIGVAQLAHRFIDSLGHFATLLEAASSAQGLEAQRKYQPQIVVTGLALAEITGALLIPLLREQSPELRVLIFTGSRNHALLLAGLDENPDGFVHKTEPIEILRDALVSVAKGNRFVSPFGRKVVKERRTTGGSLPLTSRESRLLQLLAEGRSSREVAALLKVTPRTLDNYRSLLMKKLDARGLPTLTRHAIRLGLIDPE